MAYEPKLGDLLAVQDEQGNTILGMIYENYKKGGRLEYYKVEWFDETRTYEYGFVDIESFRKQFIKWRNNL